MAERLTDARARAVAIPTDGKGYVIVHDSEVRGLGLRVTKAGVRSWVMTYRTRAGRERRYTIGRYPDWPVGAAREEGRRLRRIVDQGGDPLRQLAAEREAPSIEALADRFLQDHASRLRPSSRRGAEDLLTKWVRPELGALKVKDVRHVDVERLHRKITDFGTPYTANRTMSMLSKMFNLSVKWEMRPDNPVRGIERNQEHKRNRYLTPMEISRMAAALDVQRAKASANAIRLLLLTGARRGEVLGARWADFDLDGGVWTKPGATTKQKTQHRVPLSAPALQLLVGMREAAEKAADGGAVSEFVFPGNGGKPLGDVKNTWRAVCLKADLAVRVAKRSKGGKVVKGKDGEPIMVWKTTARVHDLRHTFASILASAGLSLPIIGQLLGHTQTETTARYAHLMDDPLRQATNRVGAAFRAATGETTGGEVIEITGRGPRP